MPDPLDILLHIEEVGEAGDVADTGGVDAILSILRHVTGLDVSTG
jgi:hypothetical protein